MEQRMSSTRSYVESKEILGSELGYAALPRIVSRIDARSGIMSLAKACWIIEQWGATNSSAQKLLVTGFLLDHHARRAIDLIDTQDRIVFFRPQLLTLMKYLARYGRMRSTTEPNKRADLNKLGEALLCISDLISAEFTEKRKSFQEEDPLRRVARELVTESFLMKPLNLSFELTRARYLFVKIHRRLALDPPTDFVDIDQIFHEATGIDLDTYVSIGIAIATHYLKYIAERQHLSEKLDFIVFQPTNWFRDSLLDRSALAKAFDMISMTLSDFRSMVIGQSRREMAYDFIAMKSRPFLRLGDDTYVLISFEYLFERLTTGVYWVIFDYLKKNDLQLRFSRYNGIIFQTYVEEIITQTVKQKREQTEKLLIDQTYKIGRKTYRTPDVMLFGSDYAILIEASATRLQAKRTTSLGMPEAFHDDCQKMIFHNAKSLDSCIQHMRNGQVPLEGIRFDKIKNFYPVIVTPERFPKFPIIDMYLDTEIARLSLLSAQDISPLSIMAIEDL